MSLPVFSASHLARHMSAGRAIRPLEANAFRYYSLAETHLATFFASGCSPMALNFSNLGHLLAEAASPQAAIRVKDNIRALRSFQGMFEEVDRQGFAFIPLAKDKPLTVGGLRILVQPLAAIQRQREDGGLEVGLLQVHFSKAEAMGPLAASFLLSLMRTWALRRLGRFGTVRRTHLLLMDTAAMRLYRASSAGMCPTLVEQACAGFARSNLSRPGRQ